MNLHNIASACIASVNPWITATIQVSNGYTTNPDFTRTPTYLPAVQIQVQMQSLQYQDLMQLEGLNIQGEKRAMYINGRWEGVVRPDGKGGDLISLPDGTRWLVSLVLENWSMLDGWCKVAVTRQL